MYAIIKTGGKQYRVEEGTELYVEKLEVEAGNIVVFEDVLAVGEDGKVKVGSPYVAGATVKAEVVKNGKGKKLNIFTYKAKSGGSARRIGHRQPFTKVKVIDIFGTKAEKSEAKTEKPVAKKTAAKTETAKKPAAKKTTKKEDKD